MLYGATMFDSKYQEKKHDHNRIVNELIAEINYLLSEDVKFRGLAIRVSKVSEKDILITENKWEIDPKRIVPWSWRQIVVKKKKKIRRICLSFNCNGILCGMLFCSASRHGLNVNVRYLEGNPDTRHPLKKYIMDIALLSVDTYAEKINAKTIMIQEPLPGVIKKYIDRGFHLNQSDRRRLNKGGGPLYKTLEKNL